MITSAMGTPRMIFPRVASHVPPVSACFLPEKPPYLTSCPANTTSGVCVVVVTT